MNRRLSVRLPDELADGIEARARLTGQTKSEVVRESLKLAGVRVFRRDPAKMAELLQRAATLRARQTKVFDVVALVREGREPMERPKSRPGMSLRGDRACRGRREPPNGRVTPGFQR
jgi:Arc/MetJ-type ribon-helix-helix transcriptional regulator